MTQFIVRRAIQSVFILLGVTTVSFILIHLAPGGPEGIVENPRLPPGFAQKYRHDLGLDQPLPVQYAKWVWQLAHLNLGRSYQDQRPVRDKIAERIPNTLLLAGTGFALGFLGVPLGVLAAQRRGKAFDHLLRVFTAVGNATPHWWLGIVILLISVRTGLNWFPLAGTSTPGDGSLWDRAHHLLLPALLIALGGWLGYSRFMRSEYLEQANQDFVRTARAKGLPEWYVTRHVLRNALVPVIGSVGGVLSLILAGSVLFEYTFSWPGMGRLFYEAATQRDYPVVMGITFVGSVLAIVGYLLTDIVYALVDPRVRQSLEAMGAR
jgi:peptide/nickel transport system permease protein